MRRSRIVYDLPAELRRELDRRIVESGWARYADHKRWLRDEHGHEISESSLQRYGAVLRSIDAIRLATREATALVDSTPDQGQLADATVRLAQARLYELTQAARQGDLPTVVRAARAIADLARASLSIRAAREKALADAAATATAAARAEGVSADVEGAIRRAIEGLAQPA